MVPHLLNMEVGTVLRQVGTEEEVINMVLLHLNMEEVGTEEEEEVDTKTNLHVTVLEAMVIGSCNTISNLKEDTEVEATVNPPMVLVHMDKARLKDLMEDTIHQEVGMAIQACLDCKRVPLSRLQSLQQVCLLSRPLNRRNPVLHPP